MLKIGTKEYYEAYAKISLIDIYNPRLNNAKILGVESPDIQDDSNDIGIEVTRSSTNTECMADAIANNFFNRNLSLSSLKKEVSAKFKTFQGEIGQIDGVNYVSPSKGLTDTKIELDNIKKSIKIKSRKFQKNYKKFQENDLYIFTGDSFIEKYDIEDIMKDKDVYANPFDTIFINCIDKIFVCTSKEFKEIMISEENLKKYKKDALNYME